MKKLRGVIPPMITPFQENGDLDESAIRELVTYLSDKVDGLFICGSYGCGALMSLEERMRVAEIVKETPRRAMTSTGMQPSKTAPSSKPWMGASFALRSSCTKAVYSA